MPLLVAVTIRIALSGIFAHYSLLAHDSWRTYTYLVGGPLIFRRTDAQFPALQHLQGLVRQLLPQRRGQRLQFRHGGELIQRARLRKARVMQFTSDALVRP